MSGAAEVIIPNSRDEAVAAVAGNAGVTVVAGGTLVVPQHGLGEHPVATAVWLGRAGMDAISTDSGRITVGAAATLAACVELPSPVGACAANISDGEVRAQATIGGNVCSPLPYGDLRGPLMAVDATVRWADADGVHSASVCDPIGLVGSAQGLLVLDISFDAPAAGAFVAMRRAHTQSLTAMAVSAARGADGVVRLAATGAAPDAFRLAAAEAVLAAGGSADDAAQAALEDADPYDDALASASYRRRVLPTYVRRALDGLG